MPITDRTDAIPKKYPKNLDTFVLCSLGSDGLGSGSIGFGEMGSGGLGSVGLGFWGFGSVGLGFGGMGFVGWSSVDLGSGGLDSDDSGS